MQTCRGACILVWDVQEQGEVCYWEGGGEGRLGRMLWTKEAGSVTASICNFERHITMYIGKHRLLRM